MPALMKLLTSYDIDLLTRIARAWQVEVESSDRSIIESALFECMTTSATLAENIDILPVPARKAWEALLAKSGRIPWSEFSRKYGTLRELGLAARDRENPDQHPANATEILYYRGLIGRAFMDASPEPREFAFIPDEITALSQDHMRPNPRIEVRPVPPAEIKRHQAGNTRLLEHVTDWLAAIRMGSKLEEIYFTRAEISPVFIAAITSTVNLVNSSLELTPEIIGRFLQSDRLSTLKEWFRAWKESAAINDLLMLPGLEFEGAWRNDPVYSRQAILDQLTSFDVQSWYSLASFIARVKIEIPEFLRPAGDVDSWSIRKSGTRDYLAGLAHWDDVEGAFIKYLFAGPLHWLGVVDLAYGSGDGEPIAFRLSPLAGFLLNEGITPPVLASEVSPKLLTDLTIVMPVNTSRLLRYQVGRFTKIVSNSTSETRFQISADSLTNAEKNGLKVEQLLQLLEKNLKTQLPASYKKLAERWDQRRVEVKIEKAMLLRVEDPLIVKILSDNPRTSRLIKESLTDKTFVIDPAGLELVKKVLLEAGILSQIELDV